MKYISILVVFFTCQAFCQKGDEKKHLLIQKFSYYSDTTDFLDLQSKIPEYIKVGLKQNEDVSVLTNAINESLVGAPANSERSIDISNKDVLAFYKEKNIQFILKGAVTEYGNSFSVKANLTDINSGRSILVRSDNYYNPDVFAALSSFCRKLNAYLELLVANAKPKIILKDFTSTSVPTGDKELFNRYLFEDMGRLQQKEYVFIDNSVLQDIKNDYSLVSMDSLADILVKGKISLANSIYNASFEMYFRKNKRTIALPLRINGDNVSGLELEVFNNLKKWLNYVTGSDSLVLSNLTDQNGSYISYLNRAKALPDSNYYLKSLLLYQAVNKNSNGYEALFLLGRTNYASAKYEEATNYLEAAFKLNKNDSATMLLASAYSLTYRYHESEKLYLQLLQKSNRFQPELYQKLGELYLNLDSLDLAKKILQTNLDSSKTKIDLALANTLMGDYYDHTLNPDSAIIYYTNSIKLNNSDPRTKNSLSNQYLITGERAWKAKRIPESITYFEKAHQVNTSKYTYDILKLAYTQTLQFEKVYKLIKRAINDSTYKPDIAYYEQGLALYKYAAKISDPENINKITREALKYFRTQDSLNPTANDVINNYLGLCYFDLKKYDSAEVHYKKALSINSYEPIYYLNLTEVQLIENKPSDALKTLATLWENKIEAEKNQLIYFYLKYCAKIIQNRDSASYAGDESNLNAFLANRQAISYSWSFDTFEAWLKSPENTINESAKTSILEYTQKIKAKKAQSRV